MLGIVQKALCQPCPTESAVIMALFFICIVQYRATTCGYRALQMWLLLLWN